MCKVSVVVPVYNSEKHIRQCLDSIVNQTLSEIEIIIVDDGSTDSSVDIIEEYKSRDSRIKCIKQTNSFSGVARNNGMSNACGKYLVFWDSDDYFDNRALEIMYEEAEKCDADICICSGRYYLTDIEKEMPSNSFLNKKYLPDKIPFCMEDVEETIFQIAPEAAWNKMFNREFIEDNGIKFTEHRVGEDLSFTERAMCLAKRITVTEEELIIYRINQSEALTGSVSKYPLDPFKSWILLGEELRRLDISFPEKSYVNKVATSVYYHLGHMSDFESIKLTVNYLKEEGLEKLGLTPVREPSYYYRENMADFLSKIQESEPAEFVCWFSNYLYHKTLTLSAQKRQLKSVNNDRKEQVVALKEKVHERNEVIKSRDDKIEKLNDRIEKLNDRIERLSERIEALKNSNDYKLGQFLLKLPRKIMKVFGRNDS